MYTLAATCAIPDQPETSVIDKAHIRYKEYLGYRGAMNRQLVTAMTFTLWLDLTERDERGHTTIYQVTSNKAALAPGWYRNTFAPVTRAMTTHGPFATRHEAESGEHYDRARYRTQGRAHD